jgi:glyoxylase-like metal-dependent hydrolase (beta-lactamase superfamily II)
MYISQVQNVEGVFRISLAWSNCYALKDANGSDVWLIDTGLQSDRADLLRALTELDIQPAQVSGILLTHGHCDHAGSASYFSTYCGARIYAHRDEIVYLNESHTTYGETGLGAIRHPIQSLVFRAGERRFPVERCSALSAFEDGDVLPVPGSALTAIHTPGHTPGHTAFYRQLDGLLFSGDAVLNIVPSVFPSRRRVDLCLPPPLFCSDYRQVASSAIRLAILEPRVLASGHGPPIVEETAERLTRWLNP